MLSKLFESIFFGLVSSYATVMTQIFRIRRVFGEIKCIRGVGAVYRNASSFWSPFWGVGSLFASEIGGLGTAPMTTSSLYTGLEVPRYNRIIKKTC